MEFRVLGPLELWSGERRVEVSGARQLSVLGMLLLEPGRPVSQDQLVDAVWGEPSPASAETMLHSCVYRIRRALAETTSRTVLKRGTFGYLLDVPCDAVDGHRFEMLAAAGRQALDTAEYPSPVSSTRSSCSGSRATGTKRRQPSPSSARPAVPPATLVPPADVGEKP